MNVLYVAWLTFILMGSVKWNPRDDRWFMLIIAVPAASITMRLAS